jgi:hypothetical protein
MRLAWTLIALTGTADGSSLFQNGVSAPSATAAQRPLERR